VQVTATEFRGTALPQPLRFPPPYADRTKNPAGYAYWWQLFKLVFDLPDPRGFPPLTGFQPAELEVIRRYIASCEELSESTVLSSNGGVTVNIKRGDDGSTHETVTANFPPREAIRGTTVLFRQLYSTKERASYSAVRKLVGRRIHECADTDRDRRDQTQKSWNKAQGQLRAYLLTFLADRAACEAKGWGTAMIPNADVKPEEVVKLFQYGDLIHWGEGAEAFGKLSEDKFNHAWNTLHYLETMIQLSHFYLGYSLLAKAAIGD
jgi:hypothetical protein